MKRILVVIVAMLGLTALVTIPALAQDEEGNVDIIIDDAPWQLAEGGMGMGPGMGMEMGIAGGEEGPGHGMKMMEELELTKEQRAKMREMTVTFRKELIPLTAQARVMRIELQELIRSDAGRGDIDKKIDQIGDLRTQIQKRSVGYRLSMRQLLTPDQREKWDSRPPMKGKMMRPDMRKMIRERIERRAPRGEGL